MLCACLTAASEDGRDGSTGPDLTDRRDDFGKIFLEIFHLERARTVRSEIIFLKVGVFLIQLID